MLTINQKSTYWWGKIIISIAEQVLWFRNQLDPTNSIIHKPEHNNTTPMTIGNNRNRGCPKKINTPLGSQENNERELWLKWHFVLPQYCVEGKVVGSKPIGACPKFFGSAMDPQKVKAFKLSQVVVQSSVWAKPSVLLIPNLHQIPSTSAMQSRSTVSTTSKSKQQTFNNTFAHISKATKTLPKCSINQTQITKTQCHHIPNLKNKKDPEFLFFF